MGEIESLFIVNYLRMLIIYYKKRENVKKRNQNRNLIKYS